VNRDSGTASTNGGWLRRLVRQQNIHDTIKPVNRKPTGSNLLAARNRRELLFKARNFRLPTQTKTNPTYRRIAVSFRTTKISSQIHRQISGARLMPNVES
jgi:hypothetical protein